MCWARWILLINNVFLGRIEIASSWKKMKVFVLEISSLLHINLNSLLLRSLRRVENVFQLQNFSYFDPLKTFQFMCVYDMCSWLRLDAPWRFKELWDELTAHVISLELRIESIFLIKISTKCWDWRKLWWDFSARQCGNFSEIHWTLS